MYHVLIVDDERIIREGLVRYVPWEKHDMYAAAIASAEEVLQYLQFHPVDILVTDIKMPVKNGLDLIRELTERGYMPQVILISSYSEFAYAQQACVLDLVCDYILKPIDISDFERALDRAVRCLLKREKERTVFDTREYVSLLNLVEDIRFDRQKFVRELAEPDKTIAPATWRKVAGVLAQSTATLDTLVRFCSNLLLNIESSFQNRDFGACSYLRHMPEIHDMIFNASNKNDLLNLMEDQLTRICNSAQDDSFICKSHLVAAAVAKVKKNFSSADFNLAALAADLNITPNYLSMKFREEMEVPFTKYLTDFRISFAKELLSDPKHRIGDIAAMVGFLDEKYFIRVFKQETGRTPKKYQQIIVRLSSQEGRKTE